MTDSSGKTLFPRPCQSTLLRCGVKRCYQCGCILPLDSFANSNTRKNGRQSRCRECHAQYRKDNATRIREYGKQWRKDNKESIRERAKQWREGNKERIREVMAQYRRSPHGREITHASRTRYRARKKEVNETWTKEDTQFCLERAGHKCEACGMTNEEHKERWNERLHMDHILPLSEGHALTRDNCQVLCRSCNSRKGRTILSHESE